MAERRKAKRYEVALPLQVCTSRQRPAEFYTAQLRDISRTGIYFHSGVPLEPGASMELTFALPGERERGTSVLVRASAKALRIKPSTKTPSRSTESRRPSIAWISCGPSQRTPPRPAKPPPAKKLTSGRQNKPVRRASP